MLDDSVELTNPLYSVFAESVVRPLPVLVAVIVVVAELVIGVMLVCNYRSGLAVGIGMFLNANFILAGVVNPSVFYILMGLVVLFAPLDQQLTLKQATYLARRVTLLSGATILLLAPFITTFAPADVILDPSLVTITFLAIVVLALWHLVIRLRSRDDEPIATVAISEEQQQEATSSTVTSRHRIDEPTLALVSAMMRPEPQGSPVRSWSSEEGDDAVIGNGFSIIELESESDLSNGYVADEASPEEADDDGRSVGPNDENVHWFSVRCHFRVDDAHYEERITIWRSDSFEGAIVEAEAEAREYAVSTGGRYLGSCDCFSVGDMGVDAEPGRELYSLVRASDLGPADYLKAFFFTGNEQSASV